MTEKTSEKSKKNKTNSTPTLHNRLSSCPVDGADGEGGDVSNELFRVDALSGVVSTKKPGLIANKDYYLGEIDAWTHEFSG